MQKSDFIYRNIYIACVVVLQINFQMPHSLDSEARSEIINICEYTSLRH